MSEHSIDGLKQRLVGAFVILSLAVIFLPMIFDKPHHAVTSQIVELPPKPEFKPVVVQAAKKPQFEIVEVDPADQRVKSVDKITQTKKSEAEPAASEKSQPSKTAPITQVKTGTPKVADLPVFKNVWMVQLGTFSKAENAYKLRDRLRQDGFDGHTKKIRVKGKDAVRVFTGPFVNRQEAARIKKRVDEKYRVDSLLVFFDA